MRKLHTLSPRVTLLTDFYVFDVETKVTYREWKQQRKIFKDEENLIKSIIESKDPEKTKQLKTQLKVLRSHLKNKQKGIYWGLKARPENLVFGVIYGRNYTRVFHSVAEFLEIIKDKRFENKIVFAHNAIYDLTTIFGDIFKTDPTAIFNGSRFISMMFRKTKFADSMNIFVGQSVKRIGEQLGIKKPELGNNLFSKDVGAGEINRCIQDCVIIYEASFKSFEFAGDIKITQASLSMTYFRRHHQKHCIEYNENTEFFRDSYFGGRTEMFYQGKVHGIAYDRKSAYWYSLRNVVFPNPKHLKIATRVNEKTIGKYLKNYEGCIYAEIEHLPNWCGLLPVKQDKKLLFPVGNLKGCWNFNEIRFALPFIKFKNIEKVVYSERMLSPFVSFIDTLYDLKNKAEIESNEFWRDLYKRYGNSLYGKFAQLIEEISEYIENIEKQFGVIQDAQKKHLFIKLILFNAERLDAFLITKSLKSIECAHAIPSFASYITSDARIELNKKLLECGEGNVLYCDTDSVFLRSDFGLVNENFLGGWSKEKKIITEIRGLKNYKFIDGKTGLEKRRLKGVPEKADKIKENVFKYYNLIKTKESLRRNLDAGVLTERGKTISGKYEKRIILADGTTQPIIL